MSKALMYILVLILFMATGCDLIKKDKSNVSKAEPVICVIAIDGTGSYNYIERAKETAINILRNLPDRSKIYVRWITANSNSDSASIISVIIPDAPLPPKNPFDLKKKRAYVSRQAKRHHIDSQVAKVINNAKSPMAGKTDIYGAIFAASERINGNAEMKPRLILLTDMIDNVNWKDAYAINLNGADVQILNYQVDPKKNGRKKVWTDYFTKVGARSVQFRHIDEITMSGGGE